MGLTSKSQQGQALIEGVLLLSILMVFAVGTVFLGRYQQISMASLHTERLGLFALTRSVPEPMLTTWLSAYQLDRRFVTNRSNQPIQDDLTLYIHEFEHTSPNRTITQLQKEWSIPQTVKALGVEFDLRLRTDPVNDPIWQDQTTFWQSRLTRQGAIATGAGHAVDHAGMANTISQAGLAWGNSWNYSKVTGQSLQNAVARVDSAWGRPDVGFDWINDWNGRLPIFQQKP